MLPEKFEPRAILGCLARSDVEFVLVGGLAGTAHGSAYVTYDVDIACPRSRANSVRLRRAVAELGGSPTVGSNSFQTPFGQLDVLIDADAYPPYSRLYEDGVDMDLDDAMIRVASIDHLIAVKSTSELTKDKLMATEYRVLADEIRRPR